MTNEEQIMQDLRQLKEQLANLTALVNAQVMAQNMKDLAAKLDAAAPPKKAGPEHDDQADNLQHALEHLETATTVRQHDGEQQFLLHRPTDTMEYEESTDGSEPTYKTDDVTCWYPAMPRASDEQQPANPLVSAWVPRSKIKNISHASASNATYGEALKNPADQKFEVSVNPGDYSIYQEVKAS